MRGLSGRIRRSNVRAAFMTHPKFKAFAGVPGPELAMSVRVITRAAAARIARAAFQFARNKGFKGVTICEKPNVVRETSGMMEETAKQVQKAIPGDRAVVHEHRRAVDVAEQES